MRAVAGWVVGAVMMMAVLATGNAAAQMFQTVAPEEAQLVQAGPGKMYCPNCGMNLVKFYKTSHTVTANAGPAQQYCSLHCLVDVYDEMPPGVLVVDAGSLQLIPAEDAYYVVGADIKGTMTMISKYAFGDRRSADIFVTEHGGSIRTFAETVAVAREGLAAENRMIHGKRTKMAEKGRKIFESMCAGMDVPHFDSILAAKTWAAESKFGASLKDGQHQALAIYLVRRETVEVGQTQAGPIQVPARAKCPVCGMFVAKYPQWAAMIREPGGAEYYFDGVKDLMKFHFDPTSFDGSRDLEGRTEIFVTDYYSLRAIDARSAWYVVGSNVFGPMGNELVSFGAEKEAAAFLADHAGDQVLPFAGITRDLVYGLDQ
jgi:nitrous oxide reductase accessory protein NosL